MRWRGVASPSLGDIEAIAGEAFARLPQTFRDMAADVVIRVEDFPTDEVLDDLGIASELDLLGLYQGVSLDRKSVGDTALAPDMVFLYRRPILDYWAEHEETLDHIVRHVLVHEIGHHFGLSDADMEAIERQADDQP
jgi:predicted Zn-dependent protease with MMP-like domain